MNAINDRFYQLWKLQVLVDPEVIDVSTQSEKLFDVNKLCEEAISYPNERPDIDLRGKGRSSIDQIARRVIKEYQEKHVGVKVPQDTFDELVRVSGRAEGAGRIDQFRKNLEALLKTT